MEHLSGLAGSKLLVGGGRDMCGYIEDIYLLNVDNLVWEIVGLETSVELPLPVSGGCCHTIKTATSYKVQLTATAGGGCIECWRGLH